MPQLFALAVVGAGLYAGYRWLVRATEALKAEVQLAHDELRARSTSMALPKDMGELEYDPSSGVYRPKRH
jgi:hypothetical protein